MYIAILSIKRCYCQCHVSLCYLRLVFWLSMYVCVIFILVYVFYYVNAYVVRLICSLLFANLFRLLDQQKIAKSEGPLRVQFVVAFRILV